MCRGRVSRPETDKENSTHMKKLMTLMLGLSLAFGAVSITLAEDAPPKQDDAKTKKKGKKDGDDTKKDEAPAPKK